MKLKMNKLNIFLALIFALILSSAVFAEDDHSDHEHQKEKLHIEHDDHKDHDEHSNKKNHMEHEQHGHQEEGHNKDKKDGHDESHGGGKAIGKGKAIEEVDEKKGIKLSKEAIKTLGIKLKTVNGPTFKITKSTLVKSKSQRGIYRFRNGYFKFLSAKIIKEYNTGYQVSVKGITFGDQVVINGVGLLRVTDVYSTDKSEYGHSH